MKFNTYPFLQAKHFKQDGNLLAGRVTISRIVIHRAEAAARGNTAEAVARYFAEQSTVGSAHYCVDADSVVQCVWDRDGANHAPPNRNSLGIELAGFSKDDDWQTPFMQAMVKRAAQLTAELCVKYRVPGVWLEVGDLLAGRKGITSHANVSKAWKKSSHTDPGRAFQGAFFAAMVLTAMDDLIRS